MAAVVALASWDRIVRLDIGMGNGGQHHVDVIQQKGATTR